jgi:hypothetical protein
VSASSTATRKSLAPCSHSAGSHLLRRVVL